VTAAAPRRMGAAGELMLPAVHICAAPGAPPETVEIMTGASSENAWLYEPRDLLLLKAKATPTLVLVTSAGTPETGSLDIAVERLDASDAGPPAAPVPAATLAAPTSAPAPRHDERGRPMLRAQILAHVQRRGDVRFADGEWAGAPGEGLAIEALSILPLEGIQPHEIEYRVTTAGGDGAWLAGGNLAGSRGVAVPLTGFCVRLRQGAEVRYDCEYSGRFLSGEIVGPVANGEACVGTSPIDPLEALQVRIVERAADAPARARPPLRPQVPDAPEARQERPIGARFSVFRDGAD
jgi:hypothetical protein